MPTDAKRSDRCRASSGRRRTAYASSCSRPQRAPQKAASFEATHTLSGRLMLLIVNGRWCIARRAKVVVSLSQPDDFERFIAVEENLLTDHSPGGDREKESPIVVEPGSAAETPALDSPDHQEPAVTDIY
jgi:hypothetical protein